MQYTVCILGLSEPGHDPRPQDCGPFRVDVGTEDGGQVEILSHGDVGSRLTVTGIDVEFAVVLTGSVLFTPAMDSFDRAPESGYTDSLTIGMEDGDYGVYFRAKDRSYYGKGIVGGPRHRRGAVSITARVIWYEDSSRNVPGRIQ